MGPLVGTIFLLCSLQQTVFSGIIFPDADLDYDQQFRDKKSVGSEPIKPCPGGQLFCEEEVEDYPENVQIVDQVVSAKLIRNAIFDAEKKEDTLQLRTAFVKEARACDNRKATVYPKKAQNIDGKYVFIVNDNNYRQAVDIEQCLGDGEPCHTETDNPTFDSETICRQKYATYRMYVINEEGEQVYDSFSLPSACLCHHKSNFAIRNAFKSVADTPPLPVCSGPEKLALNTQQTRPRQGPASGSRLKPSDSGITFGSRRRRQFTFNDDSLKPEECHGSYCEGEDGQYPKELVLRALRTNNDLNPELFSQLFDTQCQPASLKTRFFNIDEEQLCYGVPKIIFPRQAKNLKDEWKYIVNIDNYTQSVEIEECFNAFGDSNDNSTEVTDDVQFDDIAPVEDNFGSCLYSGAPGNNPSLTSCRQLFTEHKLLSLSTDGQLVVDSFKLPSACACFYKEDFTLEFRGAMEDKTEEAPELELPEQVEQTIQFN